MHHPTTLIFDTVDFTSGLDFSGTIIQLNATVLPLFMQTVFEKQLQESLLMLDLPDVQKMR